MRTTNRRLHVERLESRELMTVAPALLNSWFVSGQGEFAQAITALNGGGTSGPSTTWTGQTTPVLGDVQKVSYSTNGNYVYVNTPDLASYTLGPWWSDATHQHPFVNFPRDQNSIYRVQYNSTYPQTTHQNTAGGPVGIAVNGVMIYNSGDAFSYSKAAGQDVAMTGDGIFNRQAEWAESATFDVGNGHQPGNGQYHYHTQPPALRAQLSDNIDYVGTTNYFPYDPAVYFLTQGQGSDGDFEEHTADLHHSPIIGWMFDGYPIYGPYGYSVATDATSAITRMRSSFSLRTDLTTGSPRITVPGWSAALDGAKLGATAAATPANGLYTMTAAQQTSYAGPAVSATYPLGRYGEDYFYVPGSGDLDQFNGRFAKTPEFPDGTYAYFITIDAAGEAAFPYIINRQYYGSNNGSGRVTSITEAVTTAFDVTTNTAPVVSGPLNVSIAQSGLLAFNGSNLISVYDVDAPASESVTVTVSAGTLNVNLATGLASGATISAGANNSSTLTLTGNIKFLNAALETLTYTAPSAGSTATLTARANDGSAINNLSNTHTTTITLTSSAPTTQYVTSFAATTSGARFTLSKPALIASQLNLYDYRDAAGASVLGSADVQFINSSGASIVGSLIIDTGDAGFTFVATSGALPADTYTFTLRSATNGFQDATGALLDGDANNAAGGDFVRTFTVTAPASNAVTVSLPNFARGPEQAVNVPADSNLGLPLSVNNGDQISTLSFVLQFDSGLLNVTGVTLPAAAPSGSSASLTSLGAGQAQISLTFGSPLAAGSQTIAYLAAAVPSSAAGRYGERETLDITSLTVRNAASAIIPSLDDDAVHANVYFGDAGRNGRYDSFDVQQASRAALRLDSGFQQHPLLDPTIVADFNGNNRVDSFDVQRLSRLALRLSVTEAAALPAPTPTVTDTDRLTSEEPAETPKSSALRADVDGSGAVDVQDVLFLIYAFNESSAGEADAATIEKLDINGDLAFDSEDILLAITDVTDLLAADLASLSPS